MLQKHRRLLVQAGLSSLACMVFAWFIQDGFPVRWVALGALLVPAFIFSRNLRSPGDLKKITGEAVHARKTWLYLLVGSVMGVLFALLYRWHLDISLLPRSFFLFPLVAALIGSTEELVYRGFIQEYVRPANGLLSVVFSSLAHTGYKCCLFLSPAVISTVDVWFLAFWTFVVGILFSLLRHFSRSVWPSVAAHALFDIIVYAEYAQAPWWVW